MKRPTPNEPADDTLIVPLRLIDSDQIGELRLSKRALFDALAPNLRVDVSVPDSAHQVEATKRADGIVRSLFTTKQHEFASALQEWITGELCWRDAVESAPRKDLVALLDRLARNGGDSELRQLLGSGPLARILCGHFGLRYTAPVEVRRSIAGNLFNLSPRGGRPSASPYKPRLEVIADYYEEQLIPLANAVNDGNQNPLDVFEPRHPMLQFIRRTGMDATWSDRNWTPRDSKQFKVSARSLALELLATSLEISPSYLARMLRKRAAKKPTRWSDATIQIVSEPYRDHPPRRHAKLSSAKRLGVISRKKRKT